MIGIDIGYAGRKNEINHIKPIDILGNKVYITIRKIIS